MTGVKRTRKGVVVSFDEVEASLLRHLVGEVRDLLAEEVPEAPAETTSALPTPARRHRAEAAASRAPSPRRRWPG